MKRADDCTLLPCRRFEMGWRSVVARVDSEAEGDPSLTTIETPVREDGEIGAMIEENNGERLYAQGAERRYFRWYLFKNQKIK